MKLSPHFALSEFSSPRYAEPPPSRKRAKVRDTPPAKYHANLRALCRALEVIRAAGGNFPIRVVSGWRSEEFNARNKGRASRSQHLYGRAADMQHGAPFNGRPTSPRYREFFWLIHDLQRAGRIPKGGLAYYPGRIEKDPKTGERRRVGEFIHYDTRGRNARWKPAPKRP